MTRRCPWIAMAGAAIALAAASPAHAQDAPLLTLDQAIQDALAHNPSLAATAAAADAADDRGAAARAGWWPRLTISEQWQRGDQPVFVFSSLLAARQFGAANFETGALNQPAPIGFFQTSVGLTHTLFDGGRRSAGVAMADAERQTARADVDQARADLVTSVVRTYGQVLVGDAAARVTAAALAAARQDRANTAARRDAGAATDADVLALDAYVAALDERRIQAQSDAAIARAALNRLMGAPIERRVTIDESVTALMTTATVVAGPDGASDADALTSLFAEADRQRPDLRRADAQVAGARAARTAAIAEWLPSLDAQAGVDLAGTAFTHRAASWLVGLHARWSVSLGGAEHADVAGAAAARVRAESARDDVRARVHVEVATAFHHAQAAAARAAASRAAVAQARESERIIRDRVDAGLAAVADLLRASAAVLDAEAHATAAAVDGMTSGADLRRALGRS